MYYIKMDDQTNNDINQSFKQICFNVAKRLFRSKVIFLWIVVFIFLFFYLNSHTSLTSDENLPDDYQDEKDKLSDGSLDDVRNRIEKLENSLDKLNENALNLKKILNEQRKNVGEKSNIKQNAVDKPKDSLQTKSISNSNHEKIAVLVMACNRPESVENHLKQLIQRRDVSSSNIDMFPIIVSQDCNHEQTAKSVEKFSQNLYSFIKQPDQSDITQSKTGPIAPHMRGYFKISRHYKWALDQVFLKYNFSSVIITEDDLNIAVDFFDYFKSMNKILEKDKTLYCVSAWNDNGKKELIDTSDPAMVHRSDFFPGLGWMMLKSLWVDELREKWPQAFWDDWLREVDQRKERSCIRPEVSRTDMAIQFAKNGVSMGQFFDNYLKLIIINKEPVDWKKVDSSLLEKSNYDKKFLKQVYDNSIEMTFVDYLKIEKQPDTDPKKPILIIYSNKDEFVKYAKYFGIMTDFKSGVPRTAYMGVVRIYFKSRVIYIAPKQKKSWVTYDPNFK